MKTQEEIETLQAEFNTLQTLSDKFEFWQRKLKIEYHQSFEKVYEFDWLKSFVITPKTPQEREEINKYLICHIEDNKHAEEHNSHLINISLLNIDALINDFQNRLNSVENKAEYIKEELAYIKSRAKKPEKPVGIRNIFLNRQNSDTYYCESYENYLLNNKKLDLKEKVYEPYFLTKELNGQTWAEYELYLTGMLNPTKEKEIRKYTHIEQMLILDYLGIGEKLNNSKRAKLFHAITGRDEETTRQNFSELEQSKKKANLKKIMSLFEEIEFITQAKQIEKEIIKHQKKK